MENAEIASFFTEIADLLEIKGENPFRVRSYRNAGLVIEGLSVSIESIVEKDETGLEEIPGIGKSIHEKIVEIIKTKRCGLHDELLKEMPAGLLELLKVSGVGPKKAALLHEKLGVKGVDDLEKAARAHKLKDLRGLGERSEEKILAAIGNYRNLKLASARFKLSVAYPSARKYVEYLRELPGISDIEVAGSLRRWKDTIGDADILVTCKKGAPVMDRFVNYPEIKEVGSKAHNIAIRDRARRMGLKVSEYGVFSEKSGKFVTGEKEEDVYKAVGLCWIPPELRENRGEIDAAERGEIPDLLEPEDIKGDLHVHTKESDGAFSLEEMAKAAMDMGYEYIALTDHSPAVGITHGLDEKRLKKQMEAIEDFNGRLKKRGIGFRVLKGAEVDIRADGTLDYSGDILKKLDCAVGAVHSSFNMAKEDMTKRILKAMATGGINILAHPTGRLIGAREPYEVDMERVMDAAKKYGVFLELNSYP